MGLTCTKPVKGVCRLLIVICLFIFTQISGLQAQCLEWTKTSSLSFGADGEINAGDIITFDYYLVNCGSEDLVDIFVENSQSVFSGTGPMPLVPNIPGHIIQPGISKHFISTYSITDEDLQNGKVTSQGMVTFTLPDGSVENLLSDSGNFYDDTGSSIDPTCQVLPALHDCPALACNDLVNLSLNGDCEAMVTIDMILEGVSDVLLIGYELNILDPQGNLIPNNLVTVEHLGETLTANIISSCDGNSCWGNIFVEDKINPTIECNCPPGEWAVNPDCAVSCLESDRVINGSIGQPTIGDNCLGTSAVYGGYNIVAGANCGEFLISQTWAIYLDDEYGNPQNTGMTCTNEYYIYTVDLGVVEGPNDATFECTEFVASDDLLPENTGYPTLDGNPIINGNSESCNIVAIYTDVEIPICGNSGNANCPSTIKIIRTWQVLDWCNGDTDSYVQTIKIDDTENPTIIVGSEMNISVDPWNCGADVWLPEPQIHDNCSSNLDWYITSTNSGAILVDANGNPNTSSPKHALDVPKGNWIFTIAAIDCCGNMATTNINVNVVDRTPPVPIAHQDLIIGLTISGTGDGSGDSESMQSGVAKIFKENINNGSFDMCSNVHVEIRRDERGCENTNHQTYSNLLPRFCDANYASSDHDYGREVAFCCFDAARDGDGDGEADGLVKVWMRVWDDGNMDGVYGSYESVNGKCNILDNYNETWVYVKVENKLEPILNCPPDITIPCDWDYTDLSVTGGGVTAVVPCNSAEYDYTDWVNVNCGQGQVERNWFVVGFPNSVCSQIITIYNPDAQTPVDIQCPGNGQVVHVDCDDHNIPEPWFTGNACSLTGISSSIDTFFIEDGACYKVTKEWKIIDWCSGEEYTCEYTFAKIDSEAPVVDCEDITVALDDYWDADNDGNYCELANDIILANSATDNGDCPSDWIKWIVKIDYWNDGTIDDERSSFFPHNSSGYIAPSGMGQDISIRLRKSLAGAPMALHRVEWKAFDGCGNIDQCAQYVTVTDTKAPTPYCVGISTALMEAGSLVELWASDFNIGSFDNCTEKDDLLFTFAGISPVLSRINQVHYFNSNGPISQSAYESQGFPAQKWNPATKSSATKFIGTDWCGSNNIEVSVWDEKYNTDFCVVELIIDGIECMSTAVPRANIGGYINTASNEPVLGTTITNSSNQPSYPLEYITDTDGVFAFNNNIMYQDYSLSAVKDNGHLNGISTLDLVLIQRHVLSLAPFDSGYKIVAADINSDEKVTASDLVELRKLILGIYSQLPNNDSWRFVDAAQTLNQSNPWPLIEAISIESIDQDMMAESFTGIKIGDVNNSVVANITSVDVDIRSSAKLDLILENSENGQIVVKAGTNYRDVYGFQLGLNVDAQLANITPGAINVTTDNFGITKSSVLTSYSSANSETISEGQILFTMHFNNNTEVSLDRKSINAEAYIGSDYSIVDIDLRNTENKTTYSLMQNEPNPFSETTNIQFTIPTADQVTLSVTDLSGKVIKSITNSYESGTHNIVVNNKDLNTSGVLYYTLESGTFTDTKKMIIIE